MALLLKDGSVFLHVPKTGGLFVTEVLEGLGLVERRIHHIHADATAVARHVMPFAAFCHDVTWQAKALVPLAWKKRTHRRLRRPEQPTNPAARTKTATFCFVRDPMKWYESFWRYMCEHDWFEYGDPMNPLEPHPWARLRGLGSHDFNQFMRGVIRTNPGYVSEMFARYTPPWVSFVGRQETLMDDLVRFLNLRGFSFDEQRLKTWKRTNVSSAPEQGIEWDPDVRMEVERLEYAARRRYGYLESVGLLT